MDFSISREQQSILEHLDAFCAANLQESEIQRWIARGGVPDSFMIKYCNEGFGIVSNPEELTATQNQKLTHVLILERLAKWAGATLPAQGLTTYTNIVSDLADESRAQFLRNITLETGKLAFSLAITETQMGSNLYDIRTTAIERENGFIVNGAKTFISMGQYAPYVMLLARDIALEESTGKPALSFFLVPRDAEGLDTFSMTMIGQRLIPTADIVFDNVLIDKDSPIGRRGNGSKNLRNGFGLARLHLCASTVGMAEAAFDEALHFALNRRTSSGDSLLSFQQIEEKIVDMQIQIDAMRGMLYHTACSFDDNSHEAHLNVTMLKRYIPKTAMEVADNAIQILGGRGYQSSTRTSRIWEECRGNRIILGTDEIMTVMSAPRIAQRYELELDQKPTWRY